MTEIIDKVLPLIPRYFIDLMDVFCSPKTFLHGKQLAGPEEMEQSFVFGGLTVLLAFLAQLPYVASWKDNPVVALSSIMGINLIYAAVTLAALRFSWKIVGGKASMKQLFIYFAYSTGPVTLILLGFSITGFAIAHQIDPTSVPLILNASFKSIEQLGINMTAYYSYSACVLMGLLISFSWAMIAWGAFRELNKVSRIRSSLAFLIYVAIATPIFVIGSLWETW